MTGLKITTGKPALILPEDSETLPFAILANRGAGKSTTGAVMAEEMFKAAIPFVVVDPVGAWWGLRAAADGKGTGFEVPIFGGRHGDVPLEDTGGQLLADLVVDERVSCVIDLDDLSEGGKQRFLIDFAERLFRRNEEPLHLFLEEADDYAPQKSSFKGNMGRLLGAWQRIVKRGRGRGLGCTMISQRSAALNKDLLTQAETLIAMRTTSPQDRKAIEGWIEHHHASADVVATLPELDDGEAWVWSPHALGIKDPLRVRIRPRETFDSGATPRRSKLARKAATLADIDIDLLKTRMAGTIERAKAEDPKELRRQIADLQRQLRGRPEPEQQEPQIIEVSVFKDGEVAGLTKAVDQLVDFGDRLSDFGEQLIGSAVDVRGAASVVAEGLRIAEGAKQAGPQRPAVPRAPAPSRPGPSAGPGTPTPRRAGVGTATLPSPPVTDITTLKKAEKRVLQVLAQYPAGRTKKQVAVTSGYAIEGGGFKNALGRLRTLGYIEGSDYLLITEDGRGAIGSNWEPLPTGPALVSYWMPRLKKAERLILEVLYAVYPAALPKAEIAERAGYEVEGGGFKNAIGRLRTLELIEGRDELKASDDLA